MPAHYNSIRVSNVVDIPGNSLASRLIGFTCSAPQATNATRSADFASTTPARDGFLAWSASSTKLEDEGKKCFTRHGDPVALRHHLASQHKGIYVYRLRRRRVSIAWRMLIRKRKNQQGNGRNSVQHQRRARHQGNHHVVATQNEQQVRNSLTP